MDVEEPQPEPAPESEPDVEPLDTPRHGPARLVDTPAALREVTEELAAATGPVAVDAERASGYRYGQRAFLVQLYRAGTPIVLVDPVPLPDLSSLSAALGDAQWVLHAASQDLPCLREVGMAPGGGLFDTELAARLAGFEKVGLAAVVERLLGLRLAKEHSAADWSKRPLPAEWLRYAALDVDVLLDLRDALDAELVAQGKDGWAAEEFEAVRAAPPPPPRTDPWRRTSGLHAVRGRRQLAVVRELWEAREEMARRRDVAPGRVLPDRAIVSAASAMPTSVPELVALPVFSGPANRRLATRWLAAVERARALPESALPPPTLPSDGPPPPRVWKDRDPEAAARLARCREVMQHLAEEHAVPVENLLTPDLLRRLCWRPPGTIDESSVAEVLSRTGARRWQVTLCAPPLAAALQDVEPVDPAPVLLSPGS